jgi:hypothetical protein
MKRVLAIKDELAPGEELDFTDDRHSCRQFWATLLDFASLENAEQVGCRPSDGDDCLSIQINGQWLKMDPPPAEVRELLLRFAQEMALGILGYNFLVRLRKANFFRDDCGPFTVVVGKRKSMWQMECDRVSVHFFRVTNAPHAVG